MLSSLTVIFHSESYKVVLAMLRLNCLISKEEDRSDDNRIYFNSSLLSPYLKRAKTSKS
ncbi:MAG: hypothetical protein ACTS73_01385 [Arsenophonus sp. NEOnobi-MAG3]